ncbi:alpha/beta fold hydrolase [Desulfoscipio gibsoniae]|uniref:Putative hydrolase or acyltransferase of alpha/beta superfamily n=1 Tax=Desulfoscipio gibsoniae DSM 7213 TaxID=767817 RepID=R4KL14_9FIRM|nr:alpha/beta hydrolase [Desulfoscipio gibsoniae]AGL01215.1 putative hydrolase or acyltransferase of alpha/beta superfamily [Desulfoscipio gibsoniae DSM 7213]
MVKRFKSMEGKQLIYESYNRLLERWEVDKEEMDIETGYGKTHVIISGNRANPPLLLFHGTGDNSAMMWLLNIQELVKHFYIMAVDSLGGAGKSEPNESYLKKFDLAVWVDYILDALNINKTNIAGVSYGGYMSLAYAARNPDRVSKIVCMANYPSVKGIKSHLLILRSVKVFLPEILNPTEENAVKLLQKLTGPNSDVFSLNKEMMKHWLYILKYSVVSKNKVIHFDNEAMSVFRDKALFLIGDSDRVIYHPAVIKILNDNNLNYKIIKDVGHAINHEQPKLINREIIDYLLVSA